MEKKFCPICEREFENETNFCSVDGSQLIIRSDDDLTGKVFDNRYRILHKIGEGGMGKVYKAEQISTGKHVAIKVMAKHLTSDESTVKRFQREVKIQSKMEHPNIVTVIDFAKTPTGEYFFVMGFVKGASLRSAILEKGRYSIDDFFDLAIQICDGIQYAHQLGVVHRDLKGENIIVASMGHQNIIKILDFGLAKAVHGAADNFDASLAGEELTQQGRVLGTPAYMAPEQAKGEVNKIGPRSDIYSLGVVFYHMLTGRLPYESDTPWGLMHKHITEPAPHLPTLHTEIEKGLDKILIKCLAKKPEDRYSTALELRSDFKRIMKHDTGGLASDIATKDFMKPVDMEKSAADKTVDMEGGDITPSPPSPPKKGGAVKIIIGIAVVALLLGFGAVYMYLEKEKETEKVASTVTKPPSTTSITSEAEQKLVAAEAERKKAEAEIERIRLEAAEAERIMAAAEAERIKAEAEIKRLKAESAEAERMRAETEARKIKAAAEAEVKRAEAAEAELRRLRAESARKKAEAEAEVKKAEAAEAERKRAVAEAKVKQAEAAGAIKEKEAAEAARKQAAKVARQKQAEAAIAERKRAAAEAEQKKAEAATAKRKQAAAEAERKKVAAEEEQKRATEEAERKKVAAEEEDRRQKLAREKQAKKEEKKRAEEKAAAAEKLALTPKNMAFVASGCFVMGDTFKEGEREELPAHQVCLNGFFIDKYEVTQTSFLSVMKSNPSEFKKCKNCPVDSVLWKEAAKYCKTVGKRLPTEAEWEYAAKNGAKNSRFGTGKNSVADTDVNFNAAKKKQKYSKAGRYREKTLPVGSFPPNALGIYDMTGNVAEWVADWYSRKYYQAKVKSNPLGPKGNRNNIKVLKGGSWINTAYYVRSVVRGRYDGAKRKAYHGFRCARSR